MSSSADFSRAEILGGMQARRARTLLYLIENRTAHLAAESRRAMKLYESEEGEKEQYLAFLESFALGKDPPVRPSIQDIERYAPQWASLVPDNHALRAALLHALGQKYRFNYRSIPRIRAAAGLDAPEVAAAFARAHGKSAEEEFSASISFRERFGYLSSRVSTSLETLPPFWAVFALTLTETVGSGVLALPIAMAKVGPVAGVVLLIVIGLINVVTIAAMAETVTRTGSVRYGGSYFGRIVTGYLGTAGASVMTVALGSIFFLALISYYLGLASTLYSSTGIAPELWAALLFATAIYFLSRGSLDSTIASALVVGAVNMLLVFALCALAFSRMTPSLLGYVNLPFVGGRPFDPSVLELIFGVVLCTYFGHTSVGNCGKLVLRRDPSGRSLIWGVVCAELAAMVLFCVWVVAVNGAVPTDILISEKGTSLAPLATIVGPVVHPIGSIFVLLAMGMTSIHFSLGLFNLVKERLPHDSHPVLLLAKDNSRLVLAPRSEGDSSFTLAFTYRGLQDGSPRFEIACRNSGRAERLTATLETIADQSRLSALMPSLKGSPVRYTLTLVDSSPDHIRLTVATPLSISCEEGWSGAGLSVLEVLSASEANAQLLSWLLRRGEATLPEIAEQLGIEEKECEPLIARLVAQSQLIEVKPQGGPTSYRARLSRRKGRALASEVWDALGDATPAEESPAEVQQPSAVAGMRERLAALFTGDRGRFLISLTPVVLAFILSEWALVTNSSSFTAVLNLLGVISVTIFVGIIPVLLILSSRQKGEMIPGFNYPVLGNPVLQGVIYVVFLAAILLHGLVIWQQPLEKAAALATTAIVLGMTVTVIRRGALRPRAVIELRQDSGKPSLLVSAIQSGSPVEARVQIAGSTETCSLASSCILPSSGPLTVTVSIPQGGAEELKLWAHRVNEAGDSEPLAASAVLTSSGATEEFDLRLLGGETVIGLKDSGWDVEMKVQPGS